MNTSLAHPLGHSMRLLLLLAGALVSTGCGKSNSEGPARLPAADSTYLQLENTLVFELPDAGGFVINGQSVPQAEIPAQLAALFKARAPEQRAVVVWDNPKRRTDAQWIARAALGAGGRAFDAELSGWPPQVPAKP